MTKQDDHEILILQRRLNVLLRNSPKQIRLNPVISLTDYGDVIDTNSLIEELQKLQNENADETT
jgi:hypothetical protein